MKTLRRMTTAVLLTCALAVSVSAGEIWLGYTPPPPPDTPPASAEASDESGDVLTDLIASLLNGVLSVF